MTVSDIDLAKFFSTTGSSDPAEAASFIEMANGDVDTAVCLFFDLNSGRPGGPGPAASSAPPRSASPKASGADSPGPHRASGGPSLGPRGASSSTGTGSVFSWSSRTAPPAVEPSSSSGSGGGPGADDATKGGASGDDGDRAAGARGGAAGAGGGGGGKRASPRSHDKALKFATASPRKKRPGDGAAQRRNGDVDSNGEDEEEYVPAPLPTVKERLIIDYGTKSKQTLQDVQHVMDPLAAAVPESLADRAFNDTFKIDPNLVCSLALSEARELAASSKSRRWLLVNIQDSCEFLSRELNRDVWKQPMVSELLKQNFVFWQRNRTSGEGQSFVDTYQVKEFPYLAVVCHHTGAVLKTWSPVKLKSLTKNVNDAVAELLDFTAKADHDNPSIIQPRRPSVSAESHNVQTNSSAKPTAPPAMADSEPLPTPTPTGATGSEQVQAKSTNADFVGEGRRLGGENEAQSFQTTTSGTPSLRELHELRVLRKRMQEAEALKKDEERRRKD